MFTDEDLKRLKEDVGNGLWLQSLSGNHLLALLARLEAAEKLNEWAVHNIGCIPKNRKECPCGLFQADEVWRTSAGK